jgi:hypothetical protein
MNKLKTVKDRVRYLLENYPETRDCDKLMCLTYYLVFHRLNEHSNSYTQLQSLLLSKHVPTFASIIRSRTWLQTNIPSLRGKNWVRRAGMSEKVIDTLSDIASEEGVGPEYYSGEFF